MTDQPTPEETEQIEIDLDHPWIQAALSMDPSPCPASVQVLPVSVPGPDDKPLNAAMLTIVSISGVNTVFLPPKVLYELVQQAGALFEYWDEKKAGGLIVANATIEQAAKAHADRMREAASIMKGKH